MDKEKLLDVRSLHVDFMTKNGTVRAVNGLSFKVYSGEIIGVVGESGSGKSQTMMAIMGLLPKNAKLSGSINFMDKNLLHLDRHALNKIRGNEMAMVFQDPMTSLNPYLTIKTQMVEVLVHHLGMSALAAKNEAIRMLDFVRVPDAKKRINCYPHEMSGGMRQRVMIGMAILCKPKLLISDEATTALDVTMQAQILQIFRDLKEEFGTSIIFVTHDMLVVANLCDRVNVMYGGWLMETGSIDEIFHSPAHPYTKALLSVIPKIDDKKAEKLAIIPGEPPNVLHKLQGCPFRNRCSVVSDKCAESDIPLNRISDRRVSKCVFKD